MIEQTALSRAQSQFPEPDGRASAQSQVQRRKYPLKADELVRTRFGEVKAARSAASVEPANRAATPGQDPVRTVKIRARGK